MSDLSTIVYKDRNKHHVISNTTWAGTDSARISKEAAQASFFTSPAALGAAKSATKVTIEEQLYSSRASFKIRVAAVAMHIEKKWRDCLFAQVDNLLDIEEWDVEDKPVVDASFVTFIRMIFILGAKRRPGLGATSSGNVIATWTVEEDRLTIECLPLDRIHWVLLRYFGDERESAAGQTDVLRLPEVLNPYDLKRWMFDEEGAKSSA